MSRLRSKIISFRLPESISTCLRAQPLHNSGLIDAPEKRASCSGAEARAVLFGPLLLLAFTRFRVTPLTRLGRPPIGTQIASLPGAGVRTFQCDVPVWNSCTLCRYVGHRRMNVSESIALARTC